MIALKILDIKDFMNRLLIGDDFDGYCLVEASITTFCRFSIDGKIERNYFDTDSEKLLEQKHMQYTPWKQVKNRITSVIRGKRTPLSFHIVLQLPWHQTEAFSEKIRQLYSAPKVSSLVINLHYKNQELLLTNGLSMDTFFPDKAPEHLWDSATQEFLREHRILFENLTLS